MLTVGYKVAIMAKWKIRYRFRVIGAGGTGLAGSDLVAINTGYTAPMEYSAAVNGCASFIRRFQASGIDSAGVVYGQPYGTAPGVGGDAAGTANPLSGNSLTEQIYAELDTPDYLLKRAISAANTSPTAGAGPVDETSQEDVPIA